MPRKPKTGPIFCETESCDGTIERKRGRSNFCPLCQIQTCKDKRRFTDARRVAIAYGIEDPSLGLPIKPAFEKLPPRVLDRSDKTRLRIWRHKAKTYFNAGNHTKGQEYADAADRLEFPQRLKDIAA